MQIGKENTFYSTKYKYVDKQAPGPFIKNIRPQRAVKFLDFPMWTESLYIYVNDGKALTP